MTAVSARRSGRTTRMLEEALVAVCEGKVVIVITHTAVMARYCERLFIGLAGPDKERAMLEAVRTKRIAFLTASDRSSYAKVVGRGRVLGAVFVDHAAYEEPSDDLVEAVVDLRDAARARIRT